MTSHIAKYVLPTKYGRELAVPAGLGSYPISVGTQGDNIVVWAVVKSMEPAFVGDGAMPDATIAEPMRFAIRRTGDEPPSGRVPAHFLGTVQTNGVVWHVWNIRPESRT